MTPRTRRRVVGLAAGVAVASAAILFLTETPAVAPSDGTITSLLDQVQTVDTRPDPDGYQRDAFGPAWTDDHNGPGGHNGCDTRNDVLTIQMTDVMIKHGTRGCVVIAGRLADPYTGGRIMFTKARAARVQVDHLYPLALAWDMGANDWIPQRRIDFANDQLLNLLAVDGATNQAKGDDGPGRWLPVNAEFRCAYVARFLRVAATYDLPITRDDAASIRHTAQGCPAR